MPGCEDHWEENYSVRGPLWGGAVHSLPDLPCQAWVLELGCGNGKTLSAMIRRGWNVTALDLSPRAIELSRQIITCGQVANLAVADACQMPFCAGSFDAVFAFHLLGHLSEMDRILARQELSRVIRAGGHIFFRDFSMLDFRYGRGKEIEPGTFLRGTGIRTHYFSGKEVLDLFTGFVAESLETTTWRMRVKGTEYMRSEISAVLVKKT